MDELMGLCSGVFSETSGQGSQKKGVKRKVSRDEMEDEDSIEAFSDDEQLEDDKVCVEVLWPSQPNGVMSSAVSLPNHTFTGQT